MLAGDLLYLRIETLEARVLHVTATPTGFYVNRCSDPPITGTSGAATVACFDPSPAQPSYCSRTLWTLLSRSSPSFKRAYQQLLTVATASVNDSVAHASSMWDAAFALSLSPAYTLPPPTGTGVGECACSK